MKIIPSKGMSLRVKTTLFTLAIISAAVAGVAITSLVQIRRQIAAEQNRSAQSLALGVARASELAFAVRDTRELSRLTKSFLRDENVLFIAIYGDGPAPLAKAVRDPIAFAEFAGVGKSDEQCVIGRKSIESSAAADEFGPESDGDVTAPVDAIAPTAKPPAAIGSVVVGLSGREAELAQARQSRITLIAAIVAGGMGAAILFLTVGAWLRRLTRLTDASGALARGDFSTPMGEVGNDEIGRLARSFDSMRLALRERDLRLREFNDTLQEQVKQRTAELERALVAAEEASRAKSLFLANMSHELRTPLNGVIGMVELIMASDPNPRQKRYGDIAKSSARSLLELINDILDFSKIEAGKLELDVTDVDLYDSIESVTQIVGERAAKKGLELVCSVSRDVPRIIAGDPVRLRQVLLNLTSNAVKFTDKGEVVVQAMVQSQTDKTATITFSVRDTGIGIPADRLQRLFQSFSQVDASTTRKYGGTGLGLAICGRIVEMMGGQITVQSVAGQGSTFSFTLTFEKRATPKSTARELPANPRGLRVLVVDDNATNREILLTQLSSWDLCVDVAASAEEAMKLLRAATPPAKPYDLAILDMHMPRTDGLQLADQIKADPAGKDIILISLGSLGDQEGLQQMRLRGFSACLTKPALPSTLYDAIVDSLAANERDLRPIDPISNTRLDGVDVLLVEDNEVNRMVASELLQRVGCRCTEAVNGREGVDQALSHDFDVILMDCQMPEMDGFEATAKLRETERNNPARRKAIIIALTANAIKGDRELCLQAGMNGYVTKPIEPQELFNAIRDLLPADRPRSSAAPLADSPASESPAPADLVPPATLVAAAPATPEVLPIDIETLQRRCMGNRVLAAKALNTFEGTVGKDLEELSRHFSKGDAPAAARAAHKIKGAAANVSADPVRKIAAELEQLAARDSLAGSERCLAELNLEFNRLRAYLGTALAGLAVPGSDKNSGPPRSQ